VNRECSCRAADCLRSVAAKMSMVKNNMCEFGNKCKRQDCSFKHPQDPVGGMEVQKNGRSRPFQPFEGKKQYDQLMAGAMATANDFSMYGPDMQKEMDTLQRMNGLQLKLQAELQKKVGWHGTLNKTIQAAQDKGVIQNGSLLQQMLDQFRDERNHAQHDGFGPAAMADYGGQNQGFLTLGGSSSGLAPSRFIQH